MPPDLPVFGQLNLVVEDMDRTVAFYRTLGLAIDAEPGSEHVSVRLPNGLQLDFDTVEFVPSWDSGWKGTTGGSTVIGFSVATRQAVDAVYEEITRAGYRGHQCPYDGFWGARYAIVEDPDGNGVGLMSPIDNDRKVWPPPGPPKGQ